MQETSSNFEEFAEVCEKLSEENRENLQKSAENLLDVQRKDEMVVEGVMG